MRTIRILSGQGSYVNRPYAFDMTFTKRIGWPKVTRFPLVIASVHAAVKMTRYRGSGHWARRVPTVSVISSTPERVSRPEIIGLCN